MFESVMDGLSLVLKEYLKLDDCRKCCLEECYHPFLKSSLAKFVSRKEMSEFDVHKMDKNEWKMESSIEEPCVRKS